MARLSEDDHKSIPQSAFESMIVSRDSIGPSVFRKFDFTRTDGGSQALRRLMITRLPDKKSILERQALFRLLVSSNDDFDFHLNNSDLRYVEAYLYSDVPIKHSSPDFISRLFRSALNFKDPDLQMVNETKRAILYLKSILKFFGDRKLLQDQLLESVFPAWRVINESEGLRSIASLNLSAAGQAVILQADADIRGEYQSLFKQSLEELYEFDALIALTRAIKKFNLIFPDFEETNLSLKGCFNPLLEMPASFDLVCNRKIIFLTGPNMSGKSSSLRAIGICVLLGHAGMAVPATEAKIPFFDEIFVSINQSDDTASGYSHFYNEINSLKQICDQIEKGRSVFSINDEIFRGTNSNDAKDCASIFINRLNRFNTYQFILSSHFQQLVEDVEKHEIQFEQVEVLMIEGVPRFTYQIKPGISDIQLGAFLFRHIGF